MKKTWAILSDILHRKAINSLPDTMTVQSHDCSDRKVIAEQFNIFSLLLESGMDIRIHKKNITFVIT